MVYLMTKRWLRGVVHVVLFHDETHLSLIPVPQLMRTAYSDEKLLLRFERRYVKWYQIVRADGQNKGRERKCSEKERHTEEMHEGLQIRVWLLL